MLLCIALFFGIVGAVQAEEGAFYQVKSGETLFGRFGSHMGATVCKLNKELGIIVNCDRILAEQWIRLPSNVGGQSVVYKDVASVKVPKKHFETSSEKTCIMLGATPFNAEHSMARTLVGIDLLTTLSPEQKAIAKRKVLLGEIATSNELIGQQIFKEMLYQSKMTKKVVHIYNKMVCSPEMGGVPEVMDTYALGGGVYFSNPRRCGNPSTFFIKPVLSPAVVSQKPSPEPEVVVSSVAVGEPEPEELAPKEAIRRWDWELVVGQEYDRTAHSTFASGAVYPFIVDEDGAEHAFGVGATYSGWDGKTDTGFAFNGKLSGFGPAYKYSSYKGGYDFGIKLLPWATLTENGDGGAYQSHRQFDLQGIALSYNNYERELKGEKSLFKYQLFASAFKPTSADVGHTWEGKTISDTKELEKLNHVVNVGARVGLYDFSKEDDKIGAKLWASVGWFQEGPGAESANFRISLSDKHERFMFGVGRNYDLLNGGSLFGYGWSWDVRKTVWVAREESRKEQFIAAIEKAGGSLDKDGMVRLPQKQYKTAPPD